MAKRSLSAIWSRSLQRTLGAVTRATLRAGTRALTQAAGQARPALRKAADQRKPPSGPGDWIAGVALGAAGARRYHLYMPPGARWAGKRLPLLLMLHGCGQTAKQLAVVSRMNRIAAREGFLVLYPDQDRLANPQGCWNWYETRSGRAQGEAALLLAAVDQVCLLYPADATRVAVVGLSAGAGMAGLLAVRHPQRLRAVVMHAGVAPGLASSTAGALSAMRGGSKAPPLAANAPPLPPLLVIHGRHDSVVAVDNGRAAAQLWADAAGAREGLPRRVQRGQRYPMIVTDFKAGGRVVSTLCEIDRLGHAWSGGAAGHAHSDPKGPDAARMAWAFVVRQLRGAA